MTSGLRDFETSGVCLTRSPVVSQSRVFYEN